VPVFFDFRTLVVFLLTIGLLVLAHEAGHFFTARRFGIKVQEFGFGFPPRLFAIKRGETEYSINLLPLGGFVRLLGENAETFEEGSFASKSIWIRGIVLLAGVTMNFILAVVLFSVTFMIGVPHAANGTKIVQVVADSPAAQAGLQVGDIIIKADGQEMNTWDLKLYTDAHLGKTINFTVKRDEQIIESVPIVPREHPPQGQGPLGIVMSAVFITIADPWYVALWRGFQDAVFIGWMTLKGFGALIVSLFIGQPDLKDAAGPIGIVQLTSQIVQYGIVEVIQFIGFLSVTLALINVLPIPALDGGRLMFVTLEAIRRKRIEPEKESFVHFIGFVLLILLMIILSYNDIVRIISGKGFT